MTDRRNSMVLLTLLLLAVTLGPLSTESIAEGRDEYEGMQTWTLLGGVGKFRGGEDFFGAESGGGSYILGGIYRFGTANPKGMQRFVRFTYMSGTVPGARYEDWDWDTGDYQTGTLPDRTAVLKSFEFGATTQLSKKDSYAYGAIGVSFVSYEGQSAAGLKLSVGGVYGINTRVGILFDAGYDVLNPAENDDYYSSPGQTQYSAEGLCGHYHVGLVIDL